MSDFTASLANELLGRILDLCDHTDVMQVAQICRRWRLNACAHRLYYVDIDFKVIASAVEPISASHERGIGQLREVARTAIPHRLRLSVLHDYTTIDADIGRTHTTMWPELLQCMGAAASFLKRLELVSSSAIILEKILDACSEPAPMLELFSVLYDVSLGPPYRFPLQAFVGNSAHSSPEVQLANQLFSGSAPRLREVELVGASLPPEHLPIPSFSAVTRLSMSSSKVGHMNFAIHTPKVQVLNLIPVGGMPQHIKFSQTLHTLLIRLLPANITQIAFQSDRTSLDSLYRQILISTPAVVPVPNLDPTPYLRGLPDKLRLSATRMKRSYNSTQRDTLLFVWDKLSEQGYRTRVTREFNGGRTSNLLKPFAILVPRLTSVDLHPGFLLSFLHLALEFPALRIMTIDLEMLSSLPPRRHVALQMPEAELYGDVQLFDAVIPINLLRPADAPKGRIARFPVLRELRLWAKPRRLPLISAQEESKAVLVWRARVLDLVEGMGVDQSVLTLDGVQLADRITPAGLDVHYWEWAT